MPQTTKRIVCLAASRMPMGHCIAGKELLPNGRPGGWVRPVTERENEGVPISQSRYRSGDTPHLLDIMDVPILQWLPEYHQRENWLIDPKRRWEKIGRLDPDVLPKWTERVDSLWINGYKTSAGLNDRVNAQEAQSLGSSLHLIEVNLTLRVFNHYNRRRVQGNFQYNNVDYWMWVTDPIYEDRYKNEADGAYPLGRCFLCISLGGIHEGFAYKLIAAIIKP